MDKPILPQREPSELKTRITGYLAGITTGVAFGLNPFFGLPLLQDYGLPVYTVLFYRYLLGMLVLGGWLLLRRQTFKINLKQGKRLGSLGVLFALSSIFLFSAYTSIPSGIATTIVFLYPVLVALIMCFFKVFPTWQVWLAVILTFVGVAFLCKPDASTEFHAIGLLLSFLSALAYAIFIVIVNRSRILKGVSDQLLTFYALAFGCIVFFAMADFQTLFQIPDLKAWGYLLGLAVFPTLVSTLTLAMATKRIGATQASVLGVFEPITAIGIGVFVFGETINIYIIIGLVLTISAIIFMTLSEAKTHKVT